MNLLEYFIDDIRAFVGRIVAIGIGLLIMWLSGLGITVDLEPDVRPPASETVVPVEPTETPTSPLEGE